MQVRWLGVGAVVLAFSFAVGACGEEEDGGGDAGDPAADFIAQADELCTAAQRERVAVANEFQLADEAAAEDEVFQAQAEREQALLDVREEYAAELEALEAPTELSAPWDEFLARQEEARAAGADAVAALERGDEPASTAAFEEVSALNDEAHAAAEEVGLEACAQILPDEDAEQVRAAIEMLEAEGDPAAICNDALTELAVENQYGSVEECEATHEKLSPSDFADSVEFENEVRGVEGVYAYVQATPVGGQFDGESSNYNLFYEDGAYRVGELIGTDD